MSLSKTRRRPQSKTTSELGHAPILDVAIDQIRPSPENDSLYRPVDPNERDIQDLAASIRELGVREPLVITKDYWILSGHRRFAAAKLAGLAAVPCRVEPIRRSSDRNGFIQLLREYNRQRVKTRSERLREEVLSADPTESHRRLVEYRRRQSTVEAEPFAIRGSMERARISHAKRYFLSAVLKVIEDRRTYWPLSDRAIHYALLNDPPLRHASKPHSRYENTLASYKSLVELLTRARLEGHVPMEAIHDPTRPVTRWKVFDEPGAFINQEMDTFLKGYYRNLMQSQPNHIEIIAEKNTIEPILRSVAAEYTIPLISGRGYCSLPPRHDIARRFRGSGKDKLVLLFVSDFDPDGEEIAHSFARSMRDDFGIEAVHPVKVALTAEQVAHYELPAQMSAKPKSINYRRFVEKHGQNVFEVEALDPKLLQQILRATIDTVIDVELFNAEVAAEKQDAAFLSGVRETINKEIGETDWENYHKDDMR